MSPSRRRATGAVRALASRALARALRTTTGHAHYPSGAMLARGGSPPRLTAIPFCTFRISKILQKSLCYCRFYVKIEEPNALPKESAMILSRKNIFFDWILHPFARTAILAWGVLLGNLAVADPALRRAMISST